mgnify:CR=1 FL=1
MIKFFDSPSVKNAMSKILLAFIFYTVAAASFNGFFVKWKFRDLEENHSFEMMYDETASRPYIHRQLMLATAKEIKSLMTPQQQQNFLNFFQPIDIFTNLSHRKSFIEDSYTNTKILSRYAVEYHIVYFMAFGFLFLSMFIWRQIGIELTNSPTAGTLTACTFAIIFPLLETVGGFFYDFGELFFLSLATLLAIKGYWLALILISPIAEYNKESFLFFIVTLFPLFAEKFSKTRTALILTAAIFLSGVVYLYVSNLYIGNSGGSTEFQFFKHLEFIFSGWFNIEISYSTIFGAGMFLPHILIFVWILKCTWKKILPTWKNHLKISAVINFPLYIAFCYPGELRNLSLMYISFIAMLSIFIKEVINIEQKN